MKKKALKKQIKFLHGDLLNLRAINSDLHQQIRNLEVKPLDKTSQERIDATLNARMAKNDERRNANGLADARPYKSNPNFVEEADRPLDRAVSDIFPESLQEHLTKGWELP